MRMTSTWLAVLGAVSTVAAQGTNCQLLGTYNSHGNFNDVWGYVAPNGDEYALVGCTTGTAVVDVTIPTAPVERAFLQWGNSTWRDIRTYGHYAYVVTEATAGFQIIDLSNPNAPVSVGIFGTANSNNAHNVCVDLGAGRLYLIGCNTGTPVYDLNTNPANPTYVGLAYGSGNANYYHDLCVENGYGYGSMIYNGFLRIMNVNTWPPQNLSNSTTPGAFTHNAWPNAAGTVCVTTDEVTGGVVKFFDITNKSAPVSLSQFTPNPASIPHNAYIVGDYCHISWYTEGYRCIDIRNPSSPVEVASYDTWPGASGGYNGAWGCYPFLPSGNILVNDITTGLYVVRPSLTDLQVTHSPLGDTNNEDGPYGVLADVTTSNTLGSVTLNWRVGNSGPFTALPMNLLAGTQYYAEIPGHDAIATIEYHIEAADSVGMRRSPASGEHHFRIGTFTYVFDDDLETNLGWTHGMTATQDDWQWGSSAGMSGTSGGVGWQDASGAFSGSKCWGNDLGITQGGSAFNGAYQNNVGNWLQSPTIPTAGVQGLHLYFQRWLTLAAGDTARVLVNGVTVFTTSAATNDASWQAIDLDIAAIANAAANLTLRFELATNGSNVSGGWTIDDVQVGKVSDSAPPQLYGNGTPGTGNVQPLIGLAAPAAIGTTTQIQASSVLPNAAAFIVMNLFPDNTPAYGITALVQSLGAGVLYGPADGGGIAAYPFVVPNNPAFDNLYIYTQVVALDAGSANGFLSSTRGMRFRINLR